MNMLPEEQNNITNEDQQVVMDAPWFASRLVAILYFIEFQYGVEATAAIENIANQMEITLRNAEGNVQ